MRPGGPIPPVLGPIKFLQDGWGSFGIRECEIGGGLNDENDGIVLESLEGNKEKGAVQKNPSAAFSPLFCVHVLFIRSAQKNGCGLAERTFLNRPSKLMTEGVRGKDGL